MEYSAKNFNIRVYGICCVDDKVVLSRERYGEYEFIKFPGGGLEYGEGMRECLIREWKEEFGWDITVEEHFYTTDFFQKSMFDSSQVISIYYKVKLCQDYTFPFVNNNIELFLHPIIDLKQKLNLPIDKIVAEMLEDGIILD